MPGGSSTRATPKRRASVAEVTAGQKTEIGFPNPPGVPVASSHERNSALGVIGS